MSLIILGRVLIGAGLVGLHMSVLTYNMLLSTPSELPRLNSLVEIGYATGLMLCPVVGAGFAQNPNTTWCWKFYLNIIWLGIVALISFLACPATCLAPQSGFVEAVSSIDWIGTACHAGIVSLTFVALLFSGTRWALDAAPTITIWAIVILFIVFFILQQGSSLFTRAEHRTLPIAIMNHRLGLVCLLITAIISVGYCILLYYLPLFYAFTRGYGSIATAVRILPLFGSFIATAALTGLLLPVLRRPVVIFLVSGLCLVAGTGAMVSVKAHTLSAAIMGISAIMGGAIGLTLSVAAPILNQGFPVALQADVSSGLMTFQYGSAAITLAVAKCILQNVWFHELQRAVGHFGYRPDEITQVLAGLNSPVLDGSNPQATALAIDAIARTIVKLFYIVLAAGMSLIAVAMGSGWSLVDFLPSPEFETEATAMEGVATVAHNDMSNYSQDSGWHTRNEGWDLRPEAEHNIDT